jgi:hypothetical protein
LSSKNSSSGGGGGGSTYVVSGGSVWVLVQPAIVSADNTHNVAIETKRGIMADFSEEEGRVR